MNTQKCAKFEGQETRGAAASEVVRSVLTQCPSQVWGAVLQNHGSLWHGKSLKWIS